MFSTNFQYVEVGAFDPVWFGGNPDCFFKVIKDAVCTIVLAWKSSKKSLKTQTYHDSHAL